MSNDTTNSVIDVEATIHALGSRSDASSRNALIALRLLLAEVRAWRRAEHLRKNERHNEFMTLANARAATDAQIKGVRP